MTLSEVCYEVLFVKQVQGFLGEEINFPITVLCDDMEAIYLAYNAKVSNRTKHVDTRIHCVRNYVEGNTIKIAFTKSEDNDVDMFMKNVLKTLFNKCKEKFINQQLNTKGMCYKIA